MQPTGLSVCLLACNEEEELARCLASLTFADEIIVVVDAKSRDASEKIAREVATHVEVRIYQGDVEQKRYCTSLATQPWVLVIDPDELMPPALADELMQALRTAPDDVAGFEVNRLTYHLGRAIRHGDFYPDWKLRIFRRADAEWHGLSPHGRVEVAGRVWRLETALEHYSYRDLADQIDRIQFFSDESARALAKHGRVVRWHDLVLRPPARFLRAYVLRRGFLDGWPGLIIAANTAFHVFLKYAKLWERQARD